ncbi:MAG: RpoL/Rpb11 RNA polymerase subunit family protein [Nanoarchaeota archaeon]
MEIKILNSDKNSIEVELEEITLAEVLRTYLNQDKNVDFAAWKREHITKNPILKIETSSGTAKKALQDAIKSVVKDLDKIEKDFASMK